MYTNVYFIKVVISNCSLYFYVLENHVLGRKSKTMKRYYRNWKQISISSFSLSQISTFCNKTFNIFLSMVSFFLSIKEIINVISIDPLCKDGNARFTTVLLKPKTKRKCGRNRRFFRLEKCWMNCEFPRCFLYTHGMRKSFAWARKLKRTVLKK